MIDVEKLRKDPSPYRQSMERRGMNPALLDQFLEFDLAWRNQLQKVEQLRAKQKEFSKARKIEEAKEVKENLSNKEAELKDFEEKKNEILSQLPNLIHPAVPEGKDESGNQVLRTVGQTKELSFPVKDHLELGEALGIIDVEKAAQVSGARFAYLKADAARLQFALINFAIDVLSDEKRLKRILKKAGLNLSPKAFELVVPPVMIRPEVYKKMGRLSEADKDERYKLAQDDLYLIGSAEHTLGPLHMNETLQEADLPKRYLGYSTSFRREAGSYGKDTKGIIRLHQFDKLEMESFSRPEDAESEQDFFVAIQEYLLQELKIPYQVMAICSGDMGGPDYRQIDINCWIPSQKRYRETHTADFMTDYQSRRLNTKMKGEKGNVFVHNNDATVFAIGRTLVAILENYQREDGSIFIPKVLQSYLGKKVIQA